ncbi:DUF2625 domain-containing protein [Pseudomonas vanderleydeniana]|uniref:DUF2625 domain-containing protein n=1 Tax=Pseudomonas vanderleydeniana TaxID=2745495 RepID=A0A9E6PQ65_9PSED|nr:DUF2625 domain-containing protein [Pseudomonas vanderleydeniana]QXI31057.1 DUF2625 domain-containing protein [Pseudomonas vanderleydeniana]
MKHLDELIERDDPAMPIIREMLAGATRPYRLLPASSENARVLSHLQVTTRSTLGAMAYETGGLLIDHGWLRILGSGAAELSRNLVDWNDQRAEGHLLVADDAAGGFFSINGGALGDDRGAMYYWAPDTLAWEPLEIGYTDFLGWALSDQLTAFYESLRWDGWVEDTQALGADRCFNFFPFLWSREGSVQGSQRKAVDIAEQFSVNTELSRTLG